MLLDAYLSLPFRIKRDFFGKVQASDNHVAHIRGRVLDRQQWQRFRHPFCLSIQRLEAHDVQVQDIVSTNNVVEDFFDVLIHVGAVPH